MSTNPIALTRAAIAFALALSILPAASALEVTLRLVRSDAPDQVVSTAMTEINVQAELDKAKADLAGASGQLARNGGKPMVTDTEVNPRAEFDHYCNYMRAIMIDKTHQFQLTYESNGKTSFLRRADVLELKLADGEHTIDPGAHTFTIAGDKITTADPTLRVNGRTLDITLFPVSILAVDGSAVREMPAELRRLPVALRILSGEEELIPKEKYLSATATFKHLTLYMLTNRVGTGYRLVPSERHFHLTDKGVEILDTNGKVATDADVPVENGFTITIPKTAVPVVLRGKKVHVSINGASGRLSADADENKKETTKTFYAYSASDGASISTGTRVAVSARFHGDFGAFPRRKIIVDATSSESHEPRIFQVALPGYESETGKPLRIRAQFTDAFDNGTLAPPEVAAYLWQPPVLQDDGILRGSPDETTNLAEWRQLRLEGTSEADIYNAIMPAVASNVYWLRIVIDKRGYCSPASPLRADFIQGIIDSAARTNLSVFSPTGRHAFLNGADLPLSVVVKSSAAVPASHLHLVLKRGAEEFALVDQEIPALEPGCHPFHFVVQGKATAALAAGDYTASAALGAVTSNTWSLHVARARAQSSFPIYGSGRFSHYNVDAGKQWVNVPPSITAANESREAFRRNASILGRELDTVLLDWYGFHPLSDYMGRDSSSEVAEVEKVLRHAPALPSHEVYYYQNHFESVHEALMREGISEVNGAVCNLSMISLMHSVVKDVHSEMRKFQLIAQIGRKFENFDGLALVYPNTDPLGNSEIVDPGRHARMEAQNKNFKAKYGYDVPTMAPGTQFINALLHGTPVTEALADQAKQWEAWQFECNSLMGDFYGTARKAVDPIIPGMKLVNEGPGWGFTGNGTYPVTANANQGPLMVWTGFSDFGYSLILEPFLRPKFLQMTGDEIWGTLFTYTGMHGNIKKHVIEHLAAGVHGLGFAGTRPLLEVDDHAKTYLPEDYQQIRDFLHTYGPMFKHVKPQGEIAVLYPFHQTMYELMAINHEKWKMNIGVSGTYTCITQLALLGYDSEVLSEEMIDKGELDRFKVVIVPALHYLLPQHKLALEKFAAKGNAVLLGSLSTLVPSGAKLIDDDFEELGDVNTRSRDPLDIEHAWWFSQMRSRIPKLREALTAVKAQPFARPETDHLMVQTNRAGDARYTFVWNMTYPSFMGTPRLTGNPDNSSFDGEANEQTVMPRRETLWLQSDYTTYDLLTEQPIDTSVQKDGRTSVACDLTFTPYRIFVSLPQAIAALRLEAPEAATLGTQALIKITPLDKAGHPINASIPLRISILDGAGKPVDTLYAAAVNACDSAVSLPLGFAPGKWTISVDDLLSGHRVEASISVDKPQNLPFTAALKVLPVVDVQRADLVREFIESRKKDGEGIWILLSETQAASKLPLAEEAVKQLAALGIKAEIKRTDNPDVYAKEERLHLWEGWSELPPAQYIEHHFMLLGGEGENALIEELQEGQLLARSLTVSYPGPGRGMLTVVRSPFAFGRDVLCAFGPDDAGIRAALAELSKLAAPEVKKAEVAPAKLAATQKDTAVPPTADSAPFANQDGSPVETISVSPSGDRIAFGTLAYAKNVFVFDAAGKPLLEEKIGHINTLGLEQFPDNQHLAVLSDGTLYLREPDGSLRWRLNFGRNRDMQDYVDPQGRYLVLNEGTAMRVLDMELKTLWQFDEWEKCENTFEILFGRAARFMATAEGGKTLIYRLTGKAPGIAGKEADDVIFCDALTGQEQRRAPVELAVIREFAHFPPDKQAKLKKLTALNEGAFFLAELTGLPTSIYVLLDGNLKPIAYPRFTMPTFMGGSVNFSQHALLSSRQFVFTIGDTLSVTNPDWTEAHSVCMNAMILSLVSDENRQRIIISDSTGHLTAFDYTLKKLWETDLHGGAQIALLKDGRIAAGTTRGDAMLLDPDGHALWSQSLKRVAPPEDIEKRWAELESLPSLKGAGRENWWERLAQNVTLGEDIAKLSGTFNAGKPLTAQFQGAPFGTYLVEWHYGRAVPACSLSLEFTETERSADGKPAAKISRLARSGQAQEKEYIERAVLRLGDRAETVDVSVKSFGDKDVFSQVVVRPIQFPSDDLIRIPALYRNMNSDAAYTNPPARVEMYPVPADQWTGWWCEPMCLINGRMLEREPGLLGGKWFGGNNTAQVSSNSAHVPCYVEITLPKKHFITHVAIAEDPDLARVETLTIDTFIESRETRSGVTEAEARQAKKGYWQNAVKRKGNQSCYNVYKLPKTVYTNKLRVYLLNGYSSIDEIEVYETIPEELKRAAKSVNPSKEEKADAEKHP